MNSNVIIQSPQCNALPAIYWQKDIWFFPTYYLTSIANTNISIREHAEITDLTLPLLIAT